MSTIGVVFLVMMAILVIGTFAFKFAKKLMANDSKDKKEPEEESQLSPTAMNALKNGMCPECGSKVDERKGIISSDFHCPACGYIAERVIRE